MMAVCTIVVRLWRETDANSHARLGGRVEHVATQEVGHVDDVAGVARFIERWARLKEGVPMES